MKQKPTTTVIATAKRTRYIVISYDKDEQQTFYDLVSVDANADNPPGDAQAIADRLRPYAVAVGTLSEEDLRDLTGKLLHARPGNADLPFWDQVQGLSREQCTELLEGVSIQVYDNETDECLREAVRANLEDGTIEAELNDLYIH